MPLALQERDDGIAFAVRAAPGASRERVVGVHGEALKVAVAAPPEKGKANARLLAVLAQALGVPPRDLELLSGAGSRDKRVLVRGLPLAELRARLQALVGGP